MIKLYYSPGSSSMAAHIALHEVGAAFDKHAVSVPRKETRTADFLAVNPVGKVPVLMIDGRPLTEVAGILYYLARTYPAANLLPAGDIEAEAQVVSWMSYVASTIHPAIRQGVAFHDGDPVVREHVMNAHLRKVRIADESDDGRTRYVIVKGEDRGKIDGCVADILASWASALAPALPPARTVIDVDDLIIARI